MYVHSRLVALEFDGIIIYYDGLVFCEDVLSWDDHITSDDL